MTEEEGDLAWRCRDRKTGFIEACPGAKMRHAHEEPVRGVQFLEDANGRGRPKRNRRRRQHQAK